MSGDDAIILGIVVVYLGFIAIKGIAKAARIRDTDDFLLAGRDVGWGPLLCTMGATLIGGGASIGAIGRTVDWGVLMVAVSLGWYAHFVLAGWLVAPRFRRLRVATVAAYLGACYGRWPRRVALVLSLLFSLFLIAAQMAAFGTVLAAILPSQADNAALLTAATVVGGLIVIAYSSAGGLVAVIATDIWQFAILLVGFAVVAALCASRLMDGGGAAVPPEFFALDGGKGWLFLVTTFLAFLLGEAFAPGYATRFAAARDERHARRGVIGAGLLLGPVFPLLVLIIAWYARVFIPDVAPAGAAPAVIAAVANPWVAGLLVAALLCAVMSSADSALNSATAVFVRDLFADELGRGAGATSLTAARWWTVGLGAGAVLVATLWSDIIGLLLFSYHLWAPAIVVPVLLAALAPWTHGRGGAVALAMVVAVAATLLYRASPWSERVDPVVVGVAACALALLPLALSFRPVPTAAAIAEP